MKRSRNNLADVRARIAAIAAQQAARLPVVSVGTRVRWDGDMANDPATGTVTALCEGHMTIAWDGGSRQSITPVAILGLPRWHVLAA